MNDLEWSYYVKFWFLVKLKFKIYLFTYTDSAMVKVTCMRAGSM